MDHDPLFLSRLRLCGMARAERLGWQRGAVPLGDGPVP